MAEVEPESESLRRESGGTLIEVQLTVICIQSIDPKKKKHTWESLSMRVVPQTLEGRPESF